MTEGHYVKAATALRRALSYDHTDAALKDALKTAEAQIVHQNEEARKLLLSLRLELREIVECIEKNREHTLPVLGIIPALTSALIAEASVNPLDSQPAPGSRVSHGCC